MAQQRQDAEIYLFFCMVSIAWFVLILDGLFSKNAITIGDGKRPLFWLFLSGKLYLNLSGLTNFYEGVMRGETAVLLGAYSILFVKDVWRLDCDLWQLW